MFVSAVRRRGRLADLRSVTGGETGFVVAPRPLAVAARLKRHFTGAATGVRHDPRGGARGGAPIGTSASATGEGVVALGQAPSSSPPRGFG